MDITELRATARSIVESQSLSYHQQVMRLAGTAEEALEPLAVSDECRLALEKRIICDMYEGHAPYRPRYALPDYALALRQGSAYLELPPPADLGEALWFLAAMYTQVPSITGYPVYLGNLDRDLAPFLAGMDADEIVAAVRPFWRALDRMLPDAFVHTNLGPHDSPFARAVLRLERELQQIVPNLTLQVDPAVTPDDLLRDAVETVFACAKPHFVDHPMMVGDLGERYAAVSCYNSLKVGGGSHTLTRLNLREVVLQHTGGLDAFFSTTLPRFVELNAELTEARVRYLVEHARFYEHSWLVDEGLLSLDRFSAMFGIFGMAEAVDLLVEREGGTGRYGHDPEANALAYRITAAVARQVAQRPMPYCDGNGGRCFLHAQAGIDTDVGVTAGTRVPVGSEPDLVEHLLTVAPHHRHFPAGVSDVLHFDDTARRNPQAVVDIIRGAFAQGMRDFTFNLDSNGFIRITGYLVRKSDLEHADAGARHGSDLLSVGTEANTRVTQRAVKRVVSHEHSPRPAG